MAKRRPPKDSAAPAPEAAPFSSPFAQLASLRDQLPEGDAPVALPGSAGTAKADAAEHPADRPALPKKLVVRRQRKGRKGKTVTRISGFTTEVEEWARRMKHELGCGGSIEDADIVLSGDLADRATQWLQDAGISRVVRGS